jgi:ABC-2 type transport system ATP-binding protein
MNDYAVETVGLTKYYGERLGIGDVSIKVPSGSIYGLLGPNGAGKTTMIRLLLGFLRPTSGQARVAGFNIRSQTLKVRENVGYLPGEVRLFNHLTGYKTLKYLAGLRETDCLLRAEQLARRLDLDLHLKMRFCSRGMRQKLALIQAMMHDPAVLILDEPTNSLDPLMQQEVYDLLREYAREGGTVFFSSHIISEVERICDYVAIVRAGHLVADDTIQQLRKRSLQHVRLELKNGAALPDPLPEGLQLVSQDGSLVHLVAEGAVEPLRKILTTLDVEYLTIEPPSLEEVFMRFYRKEVVDHAP